MTWFTHIAVASSTAHVLGLNVPIMALGSVLPDLVEMLTGNILRHRGISHSLIIYAVLLAISWQIPHLRDLFLGALLGHLVLDALTPAGVPIFDETGKRATLFGGKIRTGSGVEFLIAFAFLLVAFVMPREYLPYFAKQDTKKLLEEGIIDRREYTERRFRLF